MKFSEVMAELEKNPTKKFIMPLRRNDNRYFRARVSVGGYFYFEFFDNDGKCNSDVSMNSRLQLKDNWQEVNPAIEVGDKVMIIDVGRIYANYPEWFKENNINIGNVKYRPKIDIQIIHDIPQTDPVKKITQRSTQSDC
jgi:hypothetical protein